MSPIASTVTDKATRDKGQLQLAAQGAAPWDGVVNSSSLNIQLNVLVHSASWQSVHHPAVFSF